MAALLQVCMLWLTCINITHILSHLPFFLVFYIYLNIPILINILFHEYLVPFKSWSYFYIYIYIFSNSFLKFYIYFLSGNSFNLPCYFTSKPYSSTIKSSVQCSCSSSGENWNSHCNCGLLWLWTALQQKYFGCNCGCGLQFRTMVQSDILWRVFFSFYSMHSC